MSATPVASLKPSPVPRPELVFVNGAEQRKIALDHVPFTIGRDSDKDLVITDARVSRDHAVIQAEDNERQTGHVRQRRENRATQAELQRPRRVRSQGRALPDLQSHQCGAAAVPEGTHSDFAGFDFLQAEPL